MSRSLVDVEIALLTGRWSNKIQCETENQSLAKDVVDGNYYSVLTSRTAKDVFAICDPGKLCKTHSLETIFPIKNKIKSFKDINDELEYISLGVACLHAFIQANWTGPDLDIKPSKIFGLSSNASNEVLDEESLTQKAVTELAFGGEPAYHLVSVAAFLRLSQVLFSLPYKLCQSIIWWRLRTLYVHQCILDEPVADSDTLNLISSFNPLFKALESDPDLASRLTLELGILEHLFSHHKEASEKFVEAAHYTGLKYELTGALGKRTKFQLNDLSQLVLLAESRKRIGDTSPETREGENNTEPRVASLRQAASDVDINNPGPVIPETLPLNDDTLLEHTEYTSTSNDSSNSGLAHINPGSQPALHPLDQCILLSLCLNVKNSSPSHGLTAVQMSPYVDRVVSHPQNWSIHTMALLLRSRLEASRTRTVERSTLQLQALVEQMPTGDSSLAERLLYFHQLSLPSKWELEKELATSFLTLGVVRSAMEIYERLEMWEEVVKCWQSMERPDKAIQIVRDLLEGRKEEADNVLSRGKLSLAVRRHKIDYARESKLWCLLGDLEPEHALEYYRRAWTVSKETSGRAMRSLGGYYFARGEYTEAIACLKKAVAINPLLSRSWFILGCACLKEEDWYGAREAFSRCVAIDDEDGESWNNLASIYIRMGEFGLEVRADDIDDESGDNKISHTPKNVSSTESISIPFSNKVLAFRALKQGLKFSYENWRMWTNYMIVAMDVGELAEVCRAQGRIVEERSGKVGVESVDFDVLNRLVDAVTRDSINSSPAEGSSRNPSFTLAKNPNEGHGLLPRVIDLFERIILPRISSTRIFRTYARLLTWQGRWNDTVKAYLDGYSLSDVGRLKKGDITDSKTWREALNEVEDLVDILRNFGPRATDSAWQTQARSIVRGFMARTRDDFEDDPDWERVSRLLDELCP